MFERQAQQLEEERLYFTMEALRHVVAAGLHEDAAFLAGELGVRDELTRLVKSMEVSNG